MLYSDLTGQIIQAFYKVYNELGYGFLEKVYEKSLYVELRKRNIKYTAQFPIKVYYESKLVGEYFADVVVENKVILELKAAKSICRKHELQLINYLRATDSEVGLLLNFGNKPQFKRKIYTN